MFPIYHIKEEEDNIIRRKREYAKNNINLLQEISDELSRGQTPGGIIGSESCP